MTANMPALVLENVTRLHNDGPNTIHALDQVSLTVDYGELVAIMGPSGAGKSTLLNVAGTLDTPTNGRILIEGKDVSTLSPRQRAHVRREHVGFVFQDFNLVPTLTIAENVALPLELGKTSRTQARVLALEALQEIGMPEIADRFPSEVSGGQRQRVAIARALVGGRKLILADEPTGALDTNTAESVMQLLRTRVDQGAAGLLVTHEPRFAAFADRVIYLRDGKIEGTTQ
ncbi:ABC transporter ATP-binding protein [Corynebacterium freiburgense]|uniref:ABC transporter ATP-binding protein n=1 Tax=Corynebacterium freiburgense TaxID=556548 RepID=UPI0004145D9D|nr:ABC transporter ATP-binding protein [Corynebacterium freiburgense]WJZ01383.1 Macrolide export ATP-binding/permease protein MacB [Corynebacterium freiburgense]